MPSEYCPDEVELQMQDDEQWLQENKCKICGYVHGKNELPCDFHKEAHNER